MAYSSISITYNCQNRIRCVTEHTMAYSSIPTTHLLTNMPQGVFNVQHVGGPHGVQHEGQRGLFKLCPQLRMLKVLCLLLCRSSCCLSLNPLLTLLLLTRDTCSPSHVFDTQYVTSVLMTYMTYMNVVMCSCLCSLVWFLMSLAY